MIKYPILVACWVNWGLHRVPDLKHYIHQNVAAERFLLELCRTRLVKVQLVLWNSKVMEKVPSEKHFSGSQSDVGTCTRIIVSSPEVLVTVLILSS